MPVKRLPSNANLDHLKYQAKDLLKTHAARDTEAAQRIRESHPHFHRAADAVILDAELRLSDAQLTIAREYGFTSWPTLKAHVESLNAGGSPQPSDSDEARASVPENLFVGHWAADLSKSRRTPLNNQVQSATLQLAVAGDTVTITDVIANASGQEERNENTIQADGKERPSGHDYIYMARWIGTNVLEIVIKKAGQEVSHVTYELSAEGTTLTFLARASEHDGYPAVDQLAVFVRS